MSAFAGESVMSVNINDNEQDPREIILADGGATNVQIQSKFRQFIRTHVDENNQFIYRDQLQLNFMQGKHTLDIDLDHLLHFDSQLHTLLKLRPAEFIPILEAAIKDVIVLITVPKLREDQVEGFQVTFKNFPDFTDIRLLSAQHISKLVSVRGIVTSAAKPRIKATSLCIMCRNCRSVKHVKSGTGFGSAQLPRQCDNANQAGQNDGVKCPLDPFVILADSSQYANVQTLKLQEAPETVPTGEMPRHITLSCEESLVGIVKPGTRITVVGIHSTFTTQQMGAMDKAGRSVSDVGIRIPYLRVLGVEQDSEANDILLGKLSSDDQQQIQELVQSHPNIYEAIAKSIAPAIMGRDDIKKSIACSLFGGCRKFLPDGMRLRGDINVLLLGDPSVAKSQFLKFASQVAPISVYTSGKGSSAAGLTASVIRAPGTGEFHLEGGALVLADGGLVCIDEFDKMREQDRVAIHEAMEQQTISIAKAGITTILNSRTSVLAAANPVFGRYDDMKSATDNIDFQATILSRFDLIFIIRDLQDTAMDTLLAKHIINVHQKVNNAIDELQEGIIDIDTMKKLIAYARRYQPRLSEEAAELLKNRYVAFRQDMSKARLENNGDNSQVIPITVRQLEAIVRISESLARMSLSAIATEEHVKEALRLFQVATLQAASSPFGESVDSPQFQSRITSCQDWMNHRVSIHSTVQTRDLIRDAVASGFDENIVRRAMYIFTQRGSFEFIKSKRQIKRIN